MLLRNLTGVPTVYTKQLRTVSLKLHPDYIVSSDTELPLVFTSEEVYEIVRSIYANFDDGQEHFILLVLSAASEVIGYKLIASGAQDHVHADPKVVFRNALLLGAHSIIVVHNHPSGSPHPSPLDINLTRKLVNAGKHLDINVLDHIVYSTRGYTSIAREHPHLFEIYPDEVP